jgi:7-carboxy-7-deazaguanine synthase
VSATLLPINEMFYSIQGEGHYVGTPMAFIRLAGCNLKCSFCDQPDSVPLPSYELKFRKRHVEEILAFALRAEHICFTGGEPLLHDIEALVYTLVEEGKKVHIETNGTRDISPYIEGRGVDNIWITVADHSLAGQESPRTTSLMYCNEMKFVVSTKLSKEELFRIPLRPYTPFQHIFIQPENDLNGINRENLGYAIKLVNSNKKYWRLSTQLHKLIGVR